ncbi:hypothetical protein SAMN05216553_10523 [Lentzea fradiae]|uniref:Tetratricopeptide repeat-containing protein n=1 Tax=Lentzea fradiae TaxID=200378 RepID=A0A1G7QZR8_9PSEU|nr:hypothetical protein [Lentzea fradiae]SDG03985.1 hypothetical protein SAMN05216553_10523 [Lentzea fradiae]
MMFTGDPVPPGPDDGLLTEAVERLTAGDLDGALPLLHRVADSSSGDTRARALSNLAAVALDRGDVEESIRFARAAVDIASPDVREAATARLGCALLVAARYDEALAVLSEVDDSALAAHTRARALVALGRPAEAEPAARGALDLALVTAPALAPGALVTLALAVQATGDQEAGEHVRFAAELRTAAPAPPEREDLARFALGAGDLGTADRHYDLAAEQYAALGIEVRAAHCLLGRAAVAVRRTRLTKANRLLRKAAEALVRAGDDLALIECHTIHGRMLLQARLHRAADESFLAARALAVEHKAWHEVARVDAGRAEAALGSIGRLTRGSTRAERLRSALNLALPAALATDALRHRFAPGTARERWVRSVADPVLALALRIIAELGLTDLALEVLENKAAGVALDTGPSTPDSEALTFRSAYRMADTDEELPYAAAALTAGLRGGPDSAPVKGFAVPPAVQAIPSGESLLEPWIEAAQERYRLPVRSAERVRAW